MIKNSNSLMIVEHRQIINVHTKTMKNKTCLITDTYLIKNKFSLI